MAHGVIPHSALSHPSPPRNCQLFVPWLAEPRDRGSARVPDRGRRLSTHYRPRWVPLDRFAFWRLFSDTYRQTHLAPVPPFFPTKHPFLRLVLPASEGFQLWAAPLDHRAPCVGFVIQEPPTAGKLDVKRAGELGVPKGPLLGQVSLSPRHCVVFYRVSLHGRAHTRRRRHTQSSPAHARTQTHAHAFSYPPSPCPRIAITRCSSRAATT